MDGIHQYNYRQMVKEIKETNANHVKKMIKLVFFGAVILFAGLQVFDWIIEGYDPTLRDWYIERFVGMMWVVVMFMVYLYTVDRTNYKKSQALDVMLMRAKIIALDCNEKPSLEWLCGLNERTYSDLDTQERAGLARAVLDKAYRYEWVFSESDLKLIAKAERFSEFERLMNESSNIIKPSKKLVSAVYQKAYKYLPKIA